MTQVESEIVMDMLGTCENPPQVVVEVREAMEVRVGVHKPEATEEQDGSVYGSCDEAESAGESRFQGARAEAWVSRRRWSRPPGTADADGVVCER